jgi:hypothetical protein
LDRWPDRSHRHAHRKEGRIDQIDQERRDDEVTQEVVLETFPDQIRGGKLFLDSILKEIILMVADE